MYTIENRLKYTIGTVIGLHWIGEYKLTTGLEHTIDLAQDGVASSTRWLTALGASRDLRVAVYCDVATPGTLAVGDEQHARGIASQDVRLTTLSLLPRADLQTLVASGLPERAADLAGLPDPFHRVAYTQQLTTRERAVLELAAGGPTVEAIASALYVSPNTVKTQLRNVYRKLGASSRSEAILKARQRGIIDAGNGSTVT